MASGLASKLATGPGSIAERCQYVVALKSSQAANLIGTDSKVLHIAPEATMTKYLKTRCAKYVTWI